jgi:hypothetical protein
MDSVKRTGQRREEYQCDALGHGSVLIGDRAAARSASGTPGTLAHEWLRRVRPFVDSRAGDPADRPDGPRQSARPSSTSSSMDGVCRGRQQANVCRDHTLISM